jgi:hypothetical protein
MIGRSQGGVDVGISVTVLLLYHLDASLYLQRSICRAFSLLFFNICMSQLILDVLFIINMIIIVKLSTGLFQ